MMKYAEYRVENTENNRVLIISDIHNCDRVWHQTKSEKRMELMCSSLQKEYQNMPYDCILCLGDYSMDFERTEIGGSYLATPPVSRTDEFMKKYYINFPVKAYMIPGNHELYGNQKWKEITGFDREYSVVYGEYVFVMLDTFAGELDPKGSSDGVYSGINIELLQEVLKKHPDKKIILCAHYFDPEKESETAKEIIANEKRIQCIFSGHTHISTTVFLDDSLRNLPVIFCGNFSSHPGMGAAQTRYYSNVFVSFVNENDGRWGYRILNLQGGLLRTDYVHINNKYIQKGQEK